MARMDAGLRARIGGTGRAGRGGADLEAEPVGAGRVRAARSNYELKRLPHAQARRRGAAVAQLLRRGGGGLEGHDARADAVDDGDDGRGQARAVLCQAAAPVRGVAEANPRRR